MSTVEVQHSCTGQSHTVTGEAAMECFADILCIVLENQGTAAVWEWDNETHTLIVRAR